MLMVRAPLDRGAQLQMVRKNMSHHVFLAAHLKKEREKKYKKFFLTVRYIHLSLAFEIDTYKKIFFNSNSKFKTVHPNQIFIWPGLQPR